ncbi:hypothetical protein [Actinokineospora spheciospongiae]|uniref:hypothetical protein n=1 Tax=Actinokineospora spheciospongiae TaxID=909613 RepID=UPI000D9FEC4B|nr:hypothetical protein [Actinokineospora spheciospongiae]PWW65649.1 hypothetical protein DFQ13_102404 [Actinokineospora spheciospongiae]
MTPTARRLTATALALLTATACGSTQPEEASTTPPKSGTGELRTDLDPLTKRFPLLAQAETAEWMSGTLGDDRVPGPSTYWIDAIVTLPRATVTEISEGAREGTAAPEVVEGLRDHLPEGPFLTGESLDGAFSGQGWSVTAYLAKDTNTVVLVTVGQ